MSSIQQDGNVDVLLRSMEDERAAGLAGARQEGLFEFHYQKMLPEFWGRAILRTPQTADRSQAFAQNRRGWCARGGFWLLRVPIEKHEISGDRELDAPLKMQRQPPKGDLTDLYEYDRTDPQRAHIMSSNLSQRGSVMWQIIDLKKDQDRWIERRALSERIVQLWGTETA